MTRPATTTGPRPRYGDHIQPGATTEILAAMDHIRAVANTNRLDLHSIEIAPSTPDGVCIDPETRQWRPTTPTIRIHLSRAPEMLLRWCRALTVGRVQVHCREWDTMLRAQVHRDGYRWAISATLPRPAQGPCLPGAAVDWDQPSAGQPAVKGTVAVSDVAVALRQLRAGGQAVSPDGSAA